MRAASEKYVALYDVRDESAEIREAIRGGGKVYQLKEIKAGRILECEIFQRWYTKAEYREAAKGLTPERQRRHNDRMAMRKIQRKVEENFDEHDIEVTLTYRGDPPDMEQAQKDIRNFLRRVKDARKRAGLPDLRYLYVIEAADPDGGCKRVHHHVLLSGDMDRDEVEKLWKLGRANSIRLQPDEDGLYAIASYLIKAKRGAKYAKRWGCSRNLREPKIRRALSLPGRSKLTGRKVQKIAEDPKTILEQAYPDYVFTSMDITRSDYVSGAYVYVRMRRKE